MSTEFRGTRCYVAWLVAQTGRSFFLCSEDPWHAHKLHAREPGGPVFLACEGIGPATSETRVRHARLGQQSNLAVAEARSAPDVDYISVQI